MKTVVIGSGAAGLWCALHASDRGPVTIVGPDPSGSATALAQGGIAAAVAEGDHPDRHAADTIAAGAGLCDLAAVRVLTREAPAAIAELRRRGMAFDAGGAPAMEGGHSARRVLHAGGDATGWRILRTMLAAARDDPRIGRIDGRVSAILCDGGRAIGVRTDDGTEIVASRIVLASGGGTGVFGRRTGPDRATGEGMALAWAAGAALADLEFVQFHPTALDVPGHPARLLTEALRGEGAVLVDAEGARFMPSIHPRAELAPRDVVARAIAAERERSGGPVFLDAREIRGVKERFPTAAASCAEAGLDLAGDLIPVAPAAHYFIGGVLTDLWGRTTVPGLFACGEAASTGVHGANRLASNSLLETLVFGRRAALADDPEPAVVHLAVTERLEPDPPTASLPIDVIRAIADDSLGVVRSGPELEASAARLTGGTGNAESVWGTLIAWLVARAAFRREESRGAHHRMDFPQSRAGWRLRQAVSSKGWATVVVPTP